MWIMIFLAEGFLMAMSAGFAVGEWKGSAVSWKTVWKNRKIWALAAAVFLIQCAGYLALKTDPVVFQFLGLVAIYLILTPVDLKLKKIPDKILICMGIGQTLYSLMISPRAGLLYGLLTGAAVWAVCSLLSMATKGGLGQGDAKLLGLTAVFTGAGYLLQIIFWGLACAFCCSIFLLANRKGTKKTQLPFVPFLTGGIFIHMILQVI